MFSMNSSKIRLVVWTPELNVKKMDFINGFYIKTSIYIYGGCIVNQIVKHLEGLLLQ